MVCVLMLLSACSTSSQEKSEATPTAVVTRSPPGSGPSAAGTRTSAESQGRPVRPVPEVRPAGFSDPPVGRGLSRYGHQRLVWTGCRKGLQCTHTLVPLDYSKPDGTVITLALAKRPATAARKLGTLFINPGGPGGSGVDFVESFESKGLAAYDILGWDPRGVGGSTPVTCAGVDLDHFLSMDITPDDAEERAALIRANRDLGLACLERSGPLLQHISTVEVVRDLDVLRGLVGEDKTNLYGASYGTSIGAMYAQLFPHNVGRMVLDGAVNIAAHEPVPQAQGFERTLDAFARWCADRKCKLGSSRQEVLATISGFWTELDRKPLRVSQRQLTQQLGVAAVVGTLYAPAAVYTYLQQALEGAIVDHDGAYLLYLADRFNDRNDKGEYGQIQYAFPAIRCLDTPDAGIQNEFDRAKAAIKKAPVIGPFFGPDLSCPLWPVAPDREPRPVGAGAPPIVVVGTTNDPATPYEYAQGMAKQLRSGVLVTLKGYGHTAYGQSDCIQKVVNHYLLDGTVPTAGTTC